MYEYNKGKYEKENVNTIYFKSINVRDDNRRETVFRYLK